MTGYKAGSHINLSDSFAVVPCVWPTGGWRGWANTCASYFGRAALAPTRLAKDRQRRRLAGQPVPVA